MWGRLRFGWGSTSPDFQLQSTVVRSHGAYCVAWGKRSRDVRGHWIEALVHPRGARVCYIQCEPIVPPLIRASKKQVDTDRACNEELMRGHHLSGKHGRAPVKLTKFPALKRKVVGSSSFSTKDGR